MKTVILLLVLALPVTAHAFDPWSREDVALEVTWQALHLVDTIQTRQIALNPNKYYEMNPLLGSHPSEEKILIYMAMGTVIHALITHYLPKKCRPYFQGVTIGLSGACVVRNLQIGLEIRW